MNLSRSDIVLAYIYVLFLGGVIVVSANVSTPRQLAETAPTKEAHFEEPLGLQAKAAAVYDIREQKFIFAKNAEAQLPIASLTKLATSLLAAKNAPLDTEITIAPQALTEEGDSGLFARETWRLKDLIDLTLVSSSNDGAAAIARALSTSTPFVERMNDLAGTLGLSQTYFLNPTGLDVSLSTSGGYSSAEDLALLMEHILKNHPGLLDTTAKERISVSSLDGLSHDFKNTNSRVEAETGIFASKTGFTDLAGGNLAVAYDAGPDRPMIAVVLGSTEKERFTDIHALIEESFDFIRTQE